MLRNYLDRPAYLQMKTELVRRRAEERRRWWDSLTQRQHLDLAAAPSLDSLVRFLRENGYPGVPDTTADDAVTSEWLRQALVTEELPLDRLPDAVLEEIVYGREPEMREGLEKWWNSLTTEQLQALQNAKEEEAQRLARQWGYPGP